MIRPVSLALALSALLITLAVTAPAQGSRIPPAHSAGARRPAASAPLTAAGSDRGPVVDGAYVQAQLIQLVTRDQRREAGQDTDLPRTVSGHDEFAADWLSEIRLDLRGLPLQVTRQHFQLPGFKKRPPKTPGTNLIVTVPGTTHPNEWVLLVAHYDGMPWSTQSAYDDGSGCAILLGVARAMADEWRRHRPQRTIAFVLFDGEEQGLIGSFYYARTYVNGAAYRVVALYNEEQNGVGYPIRPFGLSTNPALPEHVFVTPQHHGSRFAAPVSPRFWPELQRFSAALVRARGAAFARLRMAYPRLNDGDSTHMVFTPADERLVPIGDDTVGASDEAPLEQLGLPTVTLVGNYDYYNRQHYPWSFPYDSVYDTVDLLERIASGVARPSPALAAALALPGQITVAMLTGSAWGAQ